MWGGIVGDGSKAINVRSTFPPVLVDGWCKPGPNCIRNRGFYKFKVLAENILQRGLVASPSKDQWLAKVRLRVVRRPDGREGTQFSIVSLVTY